MFGEKKTYPLCIHWWLLTMHQSTQCPSYLWAHPVHLYGQKRLKQSFLLEFLRYLKHLLLTKMRTSGCRQESSANTTLAFWPPKITPPPKKQDNSEKKCQRRTDDSHMNAFLQCLPDSLEIRMVCAWLSNPKRPRHFLASWYWRLKFLWRYSVGDSSMFSWSAYCWLKKPTFYRQEEEWSNYQESNKNW